MKELRFELHGYRYFPYEHRLAALEVERLCGRKPMEEAGRLVVRVTEAPHLDALSRLTYFKRICLDGREEVTPVQALLEASSNGNGNPGGLGRQSTRYSAHGLHEYRGKFHPQIVRSALNVYGIRPGALLWDPFCGSGTVLLEALHQGFDAVGTDRNPLAVAISNAKLAAAKSAPRDLEADSERVTVRSNEVYQALQEAEDPQSVLGPEWESELPEQYYLSRWFPEKVLAQVVAILRAIDGECTEKLRPVFRIVLSDILREVSWQDPDDLRIRRRWEPRDDYPAVPLFIETVEKRIRMVTNAQGVAPRFGGSQVAFEADSCAAELPAQVRAQVANGVDCIISSPPYATALPYIDTQRLSLVALGLAGPSAVRKLDGSLVGSREISQRERRLLGDRLASNADNLPQSVWSLCARLASAVDPRTDGFRRQNTPAVVYRYFVGMHAALKNAAKFLRSGGRLLLVVGPNRTCLGGTDFDIETPGMLSALGEDVGLNLEDIHVLDTYHRYDAHSRNSIREEKLVSMLKP